MADIINLNKARKTRDKADARSRAEENRAKFGRTKIEKDAGRRESEVLERHLDAHRRNDDS